MKSAFISLLLPLLLYSYAPAQDTTQYKILDISLSGGSGHLSVTDQVLSPLVYRGSGFIWDLQVSNSSPKRKHAAIFNYGSAGLSARNNASRNTLDNITGFFHYQYQRGIKPGFWYLGAGFTYLNSDRTLFIADRSQSSREEYLGINIVTSFNKSFKNKHYLEFNISYPLGVYILGLTRIPNGLQESEDKFLPGSEFVDLVTTINYKYRLSPRILLNLTHRFRYYAYNELAEFDYGTSQYLIGISCQFSK